MIRNITNKVLNSERDISIKENQEIRHDDKIIVVSTFEADKTLVETVKESEENLKGTQSFRNYPGPLFKFVKKVGPGKSQLITLKRHALGTERTGE